MKTILAPVDLSPISDQVVRTAADLAQATGGRVLLIHVICLPATAPKYAVALEQGVPTIKTAEHLADLALAQWQAVLKGRAIPNQVVRLTGLPHVLIPMLAKKFEADVVVMGSHGHTALYDLVVGTTTRDVIATSRCPVLVVPARTEKPFADGAAKQRQAAT